MSSPKSSIYSKITINGLNKGFSSPRQNPKRIPPAFIPQTPFCGRNPNPKPRRISKTLVSVLPNQNPQKIVLAKPSPHLNSVSFSLRRNPPSPRHHHTEKRKGNRAKQKNNAWWRGEGGATERERKRTPVFWCSVEWTLRHDGIRRGAYDYISHHHARGACEVITSLCFENRF